MSKVETIFSETINNLIQMVADRLVRGQRFDLLFAAYNRWQEDERDGSDYIFDIEKPEDVICCLQGGLTIEQLHAILNEKETEGIQYFCFGYNYPTPTLITQEKLIGILKSFADDIVKYAIAYPSVEEYKAIYELFITEEVLKD